MEKGIAVIVDDELSTLKMVKMFLERLGFEPYGFSRALEALDFLWGKNVDEGVSLLVTDVNMLGMSGIELVEEVRQYSPEIKIICMSADPSNEVGCKAGGCDFFLNKPFCFGDFRKILE